MSHVGSLGRLADAIERAEKHWKQHHKGETSGTFAPPGLTIALTREAGAPGTLVARELQARLGWPVYDHELLERIAQEMGLRVSLLESLDERRQHWLVETLQGLGTAPSMTENAFVRHLIGTIVSLGAHGQCIIVGRGAVHILPFASTLRVRLIGLLADRIASVRERLGVSWEEAARKVEETDRQRQQFIKEHFQQDVTDARHYDLILNTSRWSAAECADFIVDAVRRMQTHPPGRTPAQSPA